MAAKTLHRANARILYNVVFTPMTAAAPSFSLIAMSPKPKRLRQIHPTVSVVATRSASASSTGFHQPTRLRDVNPVTYQPGAHEGIYLGGHAKGFPGGSARAARMPN